MMKKFLVMLTMLATISTAGMLQLSLNGQVNGQGVDMAATMVPSEFATIDIQAADGAKQNWNLEILGPGSIAGLGALHAPPSPNGALVDYSATYGHPYVSFFMGADTVAAGAGVWWDAEFHCDGPGLVTIKLMDGGLNVLDTITISQIPEPMTVALLGLGGLFLRRRN